MSESPRPDSGGDAGASGGRVEVEASWRPALRRRWAVARRTLRGLRREKTIVLAVLTQLFVAAFSSFLLVGLVSFYSPAAAGGAAAVTFGVTGNASGDLASTFADGQSRDVRRFPDREAASAAFAAGRVDAVVVGTERPDGRVEVTLVAPEGEVRTTLVVVQAREALSALERQRRDALSHRLERTPVPMPPDAGGNPYFGFTYTVLLPLLLVLPAFVSGSIVTDALTEELERGTFELLRVTPLSPAGVVDGVGAAAVALAPVQAGAWLALLAANGIPVVHPVALLALATGLAGAAVACGAAAALVVAERRGAQLVYSVGVLGAAALASVPAENPTNAVAKLAIGSATPATGVVVVATLAVAAAGFTLARRLAGRTAATTD
ncbi:MAG: ABC transporter permease [Halobacteriaceae archaeon]